MATDNDNGGENGDAPAKRGGGMGGRIGAVLTRKAGPLPVWGWAVAGVGAVAVFGLMRRNKGGDAGTLDGSLSGIPGAGSDIPGGGGGGSGGGGGAGGSDGSTDTPEPRPTTRPTGTQTQAPRPVATDIPGNQGVLTAAGVERQTSNLYNMITDSLNRGTSIVSGTMGVTAGNRATVSRLTGAGYTAGEWGGQVYAARNNNDYFYGIPNEARQALARLLVGMAANAPGGKLPAGGAGVAAGSKPPKPTPAPKSPAVKRFLDAAKSGKPLKIGGL